MDMLKKQILIFKKWSYLTIVDRHEKWIQQMAEKLGVKLEY